VIERALNVGDLASDTPIVVIGDPKVVQVELHVFPRDAERVKPGQTVEIISLSGGLRASSKIEAFLPTLEASTQTLTTRVPLDNPDGSWRPGTTVKAEVTVAETQVALAVRTEAIQRFRDFSVVFARVEETYEVRMLEMGRQTPEWTEVVGGLEPGETYVTANSFLIRADIEKSGAGHDH
jgi:cobalt-zinc-cadmium efflux system membrane fusion protein